MLELRMLVHIIACTLFYHNVLQENNKQLFVFLHGQHSVLLYDVAQAAISRRSFCKRGCGECRAMCSHKYAPSYHSNGCIPYFDILHSESYQWDDWCQEDGPQVEQADVSGYGTGGEVMGMTMTQDGVMCLCCCSLLYY